MTNRRRKKRRNYRQEPNRTSTSVYICKEHYVRQTLFCRNHNSLVCEKCRPTYHRHCDVCEAHSAVYSIKPSLLELKRAVDLTIQRCEQTIDSFHEDLENSLIELDDMECRIINMFSKMKRTLRTTGLEKAAIMNEQLEQVNRFSKEIRKFEAAETENDIAIVIQKASDLRCLDHELSMLVDKNYCLKLNVKFRREIIEILKDENKDNGIGTVSVLKSILVSKHTEVNLELEKSKRVSKQDSHTEVGIPQYVGITCLSRDRIVVVDDHNRMCKVLNIHLKTIASYPCAYPPVGVTAISDTEFAVTSGVQYFVDILQLSDRNEITLMKRFSATSCYDSVCHISGQRLALTTFADRRPVRVMIKDGDERDDAISLPKKAMQMGGASVAFLAQLDTLVFADRFENTVTFLNIGDNSLHVIKDNTFDGPRGVCVSPSGYVYICNQNAHSIVEISPSGKVITSFKLRMKYPRAVAITTDGTKMIVSNGITHSGRIQLYTIK